MIRNFLEKAKRLKISNYITFLLIVYFILLFGFLAIFYYTYSSSVESSNQAYNQSIAEAYSDKINNKLSSLINNAKNLCSNEKIQGYVEELSSDTQDNSYKNVKSLVSQFLITNYEVYDIIFSNGKNTMSFYMNQKDFSALPSISINDSSVKTAYVNRNPVFLIPIELIKNTRKIGVCYLVTYQDALSEILDSRIIAANTECYIVTDAVEIFYSPNKIGSKKTDAIYNLVLNNTTSNESRYQAGKTEYFVNHCELELKSLHLYSFTPCIEPYNKEMPDIYVLFIIFLAIFVIFIIFVLFFLHRLDHSFSSLQQYIEEKKTIEIPIPTNLFSNEINLLAKAVDDMANNICTLQNENLNIKILQNESRLRVMHNQVNPHFVFNTLNCIIGMARVSETQKIEKLCIGMSEIMRYSISENLLATLDEEIKIVERYLTIQHIRFPSRFLYEINIDPNMRNKQIVRFSIQPLIENAIKYGLEPMESGGKLILNGYIQDEDMVFIVSDNGVGIDPETYEILQKKLSGESDEKLVSNGLGIGILNINNRLKLYYGEKYGVELKSSREMGTIAKITMPLEAPLRPKLQ